MKRGELWRYEPIINRPGHPTARLIVSADSVNRNEVLPVVYVMHVVDTDPQSLLAVWAPFNLETSTGARCIASVRQYENASLPV